MSRKKAAILNITATLAGIPLAALAVGAGATSIPWLAALLTLPSAIVAASGTIGSQFAKLKPQEQKEENLELPVPSWWDSDDASWQGLCVEIGQYLPALLPEMVQRMGMVQGEDILTEEIARQIFTTLLVETLTTKRFTWAPAPQDRKRVAEEIATPILQKLDAVFLPIIERLQRERFLEEAHKTRQSSEQIASHTEKMANILEEQYRASQPRMLSLEEIAILRQKYCDALYEQWKMLDFKGIQHTDLNRPVSIPLTEVFILPDVLVGVPEYETLERDEIVKRDEFKKEKQERNRENEREQAAHQDQRHPKGKQIIVQREDLRIVLGKHRRLVVLGDPGSGKSTLLRYLMLTLAEPSNRFSTEFPQLASEAQVMSPLYTPLASYAETWLSHSVEERSLIDFLPGYLRYTYLDKYTNFLLEQLEQGMLFILFDGLDEIPDTSLRIQVVRQLETFTQSYPKNHFIVTSCFL